MNKINNKRKLRDRSRIAKPVIYTPKVDPKDFKDDISVDSDWDKNEEQHKEKKEYYEKDGFVVDDKDVEYLSDSDPDSESEYIESEEDTEDVYTED